MAFPDGWIWRIPITISPAAVNAQLTDFTVLITAAMGTSIRGDNGPLDSAGTRSSDGGDIRFSLDQAGSQQLPVDIIRWDAAPIEADRYCHLAVKVPVISAVVDTTIYMWFGNPGEVQPPATDPYGQFAAYDSATVAYVPEGIYVDGQRGRTQRESTRAGWTLIGAASVEDTGAEGFKSARYQNPGIAQNLAHNEAYDDLFLPGNQITSLTTSFVFEGTADGRMLLAMANPQFTDRIPALYTDTAPRIRAAFRGANGNPGVLETIYSVTTSQQFFATRYDHSILRLDLFTNTGPFAQRFGSVPTFRAATGGPLDFVLGAQPSTSTYFSAVQDGKYSCIKVSSVARSDAWLRAETLNLRESSTFLSVGAAEPTVTTVALSSDSVLSGTPSIQSPAFTSIEVITLAASDVSSGVPVLGVPVAAATSEVSLAASDVAAGSPVIQPPAITVNVTQSLSASDLASGTPFVGVPVLAKPLPGEVVRFAARLTFSSTFATHIWEET